MPNVIVTHVSDEEITNTETKKQPWSQVHNIIKGIREAHAISCKDGVHLQVWNHVKAK